MTQQYETGHAKNVANLQRLIEQILLYPNYNPSVDNLKIPAVQSLYQQAIVIIDKVKDSKIANKSAIHLRQEAYTNLKPIATRIINQLDVLNLNEGTFKEAKSFNSLIQGSRKNSGTPENSVSQSRQSYTQLAENFSKLLQLISTINTYNPNTEELKLTNLNDYHTSLVKATQKVNQTEAELKTKYTERNNILYNETNGLYEVAQNIKKYVKSVYGATSPEYSNVSNIKFTDQ